MSTIRRCSSLITHHCYENGWGGRIRTYECRIQRPVPYHLATPQYRDSESAQGPNARRYSRREIVSTGKTRQPISVCSLLRTCPCDDSFSKIPKALGPLPANNELLAPAWSSAFLTRSISGSALKIT